MKNLCTLYHLSLLIKKRTCFKSAENAFCIDLILTNKSCKYGNSRTIAIETSFFDFHRLPLTMLKTSYKNASKGSFVTKRIFFCLFPSSAQHDRLTWNFKWKICFYNHRDFDLSSISQKTVCQVEWLPFYYKVNSSRVHEEN